MAGPADRMVAPELVIPADQSVPELVAGDIINQPHLAITTVHHNGAKSPTVVTLHVINVHL